MFVLGENCLHAEERKPRSYEIKLRILNVKERISEMIVGGINKKDSQTIITLFAPPIQFLLFSDLNIVNIHNVINYKL